MMHLDVRLALLAGLITLALQVPAAPAVRAATKDFALTRDGKPVATIVVSKEPVRAVAFAAWELRYHIQKMTSATLPILPDDAPVTGPRILVGESEATRRLNIRGSAFKPQEYLIRFLPDTLVLIGRDSNMPGSSNVSVSGELAWAPGKFGKAVEFDGTAALRVGDCGFSDEEGSLEAWVWLPAEPQPREATVLRLDGSDPWTYHILRRVEETRRISYVTYDGQQGSSVTSGDLEEGWHHILGTYSIATGQMELFVDGVSQGRSAYRKTTCSRAALNIGGIAPGSVDGQVGNPLVGLIDEVRVSDVRREPTEEGAGGPYVADSHTQLLLHFDEGSGVPKDYSGITRPADPPDMFDDQGTSYAVHDFLDRFCGVRWYGPTELGMVCPEKTTLVVQPREVRRAPAFAYRHPWPPHAFGIVKTLWNNASPQDVRLFYARLKVGGQAYACNHSFYGFYDRFWEQNPDKPDVFEGKHPEYFAQGYEGKPPQLCYSNENLARQVVQDARDYFDGKGLKPGAQAAGDYFALVPMDNSSYCKCADCQAQLNPAEADNPQFSNGYASDYVYSFANRVARELGRSHPGKHLSCLAYARYAYYPRRARPEPNISVQMCLHVRNWWAPSMERNDMSFYREWVSREGGKRPLYLWLYYCFPEEIAMNGKFHCFPGFFAHTAARQIRMFHRDGIRGAFLNGLGEQVDTYVTLRMLDDPTIDLDQLLDEFFGRYYGAAAAPMKRLYLRIEEIYSSPRYYPEEVQKENRHFHQTEEMAWGYLGTAERMAELGEYMRQARRAARTDVEKQRVELFEKGVWDYMVEGRRKWADRQALEPERERLRAQAPPSARVPRVAAAAGDVDKVDWSAALILDRWFALEGYRQKRPVAAWLAHDGEYLYVQLQETGLDTAALVAAPDIWSGDDWELFFAAQRGKPYRQLGVNPAGKYAAVHCDENDGEWGSGARVTSVALGDTWTVRVALPLTHLLPGGVKPGQAFYANLYRASPGATDLLAWSPNFTRSFHETSRLGKLTLE